MFVLVVLSVVESMLLNDLAIPIVSHDQVVVSSVGIACQACMNGMDFVVGHESS